jgi:HPt (histidine-containing phosphotransfer) domain-containing protein
VPTPTSFVEKDFEDFRKMMSGEETTAWLSRLSEELQATFFDQPLDTLERSQLARRAHAIVSQAGFLGFADLARLCGALEEACATRADLSASFERASRAAQAACITISALNPAKP